MLQIRCAENFWINKPGHLNSLLNIKMKSGEWTVDHIANMKATFLRLVGENKPASNSLQAAIIVPSLSTLLQYAAMTASLDTMKDGPACWVYVSMIFVAKRKRHKSRSKSIQKKDTCLVTLIPSISTNAIKSTERESNKGGFRTFNCEKQGYIAWACSMRYKTRHNIRFSREGKQVQRLAMVRIHYSPTERLLVNDTIQETHVDKITWK